ncbi:MAG: hypothetical protein VB025_14390 [Sphaerochaeta sp.]|nr:hypothetical protein [Sphaerochaeta sp.]
MKKCVVFSFNFPPRIGGESLVTYKLLNNSENEYDVISSSYSKNSTGDVRLNEKITLWSTPSGIGWILFALKKYSYLKKKKKFDCMMSRSMPVFSHIPAIFIKVFHPSVAWIASISDPIYNTPYRDDSTLKKKVINRIFDTVEGIVYRRADKLVFTNQYMMEFILQGKYKKFREKALVIPFGYDNSILPVENKEIKDLVENIHLKRERIVIGYIGALYGDRNADIMIEGYKKYLAEKSNVDRTVEIIFLGISKGRIVDDIKEVNLENFIHVIGTVPYEQSLYCMQQVDGLFLIDLEFPHIRPSIFLPSKVYDYIHSKKTIVVFGSSTGPIVDLLAGTGSLRYEYSPEKVKECLLNLSIELPQPVYKNFESYSIKDVSEKLDELLEKL